MARLSPQGKFRALDSNGDPLSGGKLYTYEAGTSTPKDTYTSEDESVANANPVILDANGYADVWLASGSYKFVLTDSADVTQWTIDDVSSGVAEGYLSTVVSQSTNLNVTSVYQNNLIVCTAALTLSLLPAATASEGFAFTVKNNGSGDVTVDPDGSETIDGNATITIGAGASADIVCDGTNWVSVGNYSLESLSDTNITSAAEGENLVFDGTNWVNQAPDNGAKLSNTGQALSASTWTTADLTVDRDTQSWFDTGTDRFTPTQAGVYQVSAIVFNVTAASDTGFRLNVSGTTAVDDELIDEQGTVANHGFSYANTVYLNGTTDYVEFEVYSDAAATVRVRSVSIYKLG